ncbi:MAG: flagellar biosynthetic protein FliR [Lachnospiraceae bacterium]|nr:flagellar biosynthetic protein FliR [Lachnospiraceae bacterium]
MIDYSFPIEELEYFLLIMTRITCFVYVAPFFSIGSVPNRVKIGFSFFLSILLYYVTMPHIYVSGETLLSIAMMVLKEAAVGLLLGLAAYICQTIVLFAGRIVDMEMGFAMASQMDPATKQDATISGVYYQYMFMMLMVVTGLYKYFVSALAETFILIPIGKAVFNYDSLLQSMIKFLGQYMLIGLQICLPVFCVIMLLNAILGILAKVAPQMNMFAVGIQLKVFTGLAVLFITVGLLPKLSDLIFKAMQRGIVSFVEGLMDAGL